MYQVPPVANALPMANHCVEFSEPCTSHGKLWFRNRQLPRYSCNSLTHKLLFHNCVLIIWLPLVGTCPRRGTSWCTFHGQECKMGLDVPTPVVFLSFCIDKILSWLKNVKVYSVCTQSSLPRGLVHYPWPTIVWSSVNRAQAMANCDFATVNCVGAVVLAWHTNCYCTTVPLLFGCPCWVLAQGEVLHGVSSHCQECQMVLDVPTPMVLLSFCIDRILSWLKNVKVYSVWTQNSLPRRRMHYPLPIMEWSSVDCALAMANTVTFELCHNQFCETTSGSIVLCSTDVCGIL